MPSMQGTSHLAFTVSDPRTSIEWYEKVFGGARVPMTDEPGHLVIGLLTLDGCFIGLHGHGATPKGDQFSEFRVGLDHVAFRCADRAAVEEWAKHLDEVGVEHSGLKDVPYGTVLTFRDPDNIQLEFYSVPPGA
ncbi:MAG: VOC family protein [Actinobacteria bacterium]|nr:MAG: VOC family protein [Actinomycetota bacterium]